MTANSSTGALRHLRRRDETLLGLIARVGPCRHQASRVPCFAALLRSIVHQQLATRAAEAIHARTCATLGRTHPRAEDVLCATDEALRAAGLSWAKIAALRDLAGRVSAGLSLRRLGRLPDEEVIERLTVVRGIGRWTAQMFLMFRLDRPDVLPLGDYGIRVAVQRAYGLDQLPTPEQLTQLAEPWRPFRTIACWYLWRSLELP